MSAAGGGDELSSCGRVSSAHTGPSHVRAMGRFSHSWGGGEDRGLVKGYTARHTTAARHATAARPADTVRAPRTERTRRADTSAARHT